MTDIAIIGSGAAGLAAARTLRDAGHRCDIYESSRQLGGRMRSEFFDDITVDYGFQLINSWYPSLKEVLGNGEYETLDLRNFKPGVQTMTEEGMAMFADPIRAPRLVPALLRSQVNAAFSMRDMLGLQRWIGDEMKHRSSLEVRKVRDNQKKADVSVAESLNRRGVTGRFRIGALNPMMEAFLLDKHGESSAVLAKWLIATLLRGTLAVPRRGMGDMSAIMGRVHGMVSHVGAFVTSLARVSDGIRVSVDGAPDATYRKVILALGPVEEAALLETLGMRIPQLRSVGCSTWWFVSDEPVDDKGLITLDSCQNSPVSLAAEVTAAAPDYAPGRHLIAGSTVHGSPCDSMSDLPTDLEMKEHLGRLFGVDSKKWDLVTRQDVPHAKPIIPPTKAIPQRDTSTLIADDIALAGVQHSTPTLDGELRSGQRAARDISTMLSKE